MIIFLPIVAWILTGLLKFFIRKMSNQKETIGLGGWPSNHTSIVSSVCAFIFWKEGVNSTYLLISCTLAFIVIIDALDLRNQIGKHAKAINQLSVNDKLKTTTGHTMFQVLSGIVIGFCIGSGYYYFLQS